jgi:two-component system LytT family response regulator
VSGIRTLVIDDEPVARSRMVALLKQEPDVQVVGECASGFAALEAIQQADADLILLDIQMPELSGFEVAKRIGPDRKPVVVFVTAHDEYAVGAFDLRATDYLLKPFSAQRFKMAIDHARHAILERRATTLNEQLLSLLPDRQTPPSGRDRILVRSAGRIRFISATDVDWCEAAGNYIRLHVGTEEHLIRDTMGHFQHELDPRRFVRIHRSTIVNVDRIQELRSSFNGEYLVLLRNGTRLTLSRGYRDALHRFL